MKKRNANRFLNWMEVTPYCGTIYVILTMKYKYLNFQKYKIFNRMILINIQRTMLYVFNQHLINI